MFSTRRVGAARKLNDLASGLRFEVSKVFLISTVALARYRVLRWRRSCTAPKIPINFLQTNSRCATRPPQCLLPRC
jgi:hypothetical protein